MVWNDFLLPASWRGVPFGVLSAEIQPGRSTAEHTYPYRETDPVWMEDTGSGPRPFSFTGFLVDGDVFAGGLGIFLQRDLMVAACQQKGPGTLIHPSLGVRTVVLTDGCRMVERVDLGGAIELTFRFQESAAGPIYPTNGTSTTNAVSSAAAGTNSASSTSLLGSIGGAIQTGADAVGKAAETVGGFVAQAESVVGTATRYVGAVAGVVGFAGRFAGGARAVTQGPAQTLSSALAAATAARTAVTVAGNAANELASAL